LTRGSDCVVDPEAHTRVTLKDVVASAYRPSLSTVADTRVALKRVVANGRVRGCRFLGPLLF
jgi:hypothetical protein